MSGQGKKPGNKQEKPENKSDQQRLLQAMVGAANRTAAARIAAGIILAANRPHSIGEALDILRNVQFSIAPAPQNPAYNAWFKLKDRHLGQQHE